ncbi:Uncharacterised protein [Mycobacteroides abscessus subsp. abscessus]|nr:Uncharacterised protein [Mycobacteroides abscessus subsp. abscessus]
MSTGADDLLGQPEVVVEGVELLPRIEDVRGVAQGHLGDRRVGGPDGFDGRAHLLDVIEGVEDAEDVDAGPRRLVDEGIGDLRRVRGVADRVASAQEHLQGDVRDRLPQLGQALPGILAEEAQRDIVGRPAPRLDAQQLGRHPGDVPGHGEEIPGAHPGGEQRLVGVAEGRVGHGQRRLLPQGTGEALGAELEETITAAGRRGLGEVDLRQLLRGTEMDLRFAVGAVDGDVGEVVEDLRAAVGAHPGVEKLRTLLDEGCRDVALDEGVVLEDGLEEADVR